MKIVLATRNKGKMKELEDIFGEYGFNVELVGLDLFPDIGEIKETGTTFLENALIKAKTVAEYTNFVTVADDSGLEIDALEGAPGIFSARFAGEQASDEENNKKVLDLLKGVPLSKRTARFRCVIVAYKPSGKYIATEGIWEGRIAIEPRGSNGFGYDPIFEDLETGLTAAEMSIWEKNKKSHRFKAIKSLAEQWSEFIKND